MNKSLTYPWMFSFGVCVALVLEIIRLQLVPVTLPLEILKVRLVV